MPEEKKKKQSTLPFLLIVLGIALVITGYYVYTMYFQPSSQETSQLEVTSKQFPLKKVDWDKELFGSPIFQSLTTSIPSEITSGTGDVGNDSLFISTK